LRLGGTTTVFGTPAYASVMTVQNGAQAVLTDCIGAGSRGYAMQTLYCVLGDGQPPLLVLTGSSAELYRCTMTGPAATNVACSGIQLATAPGPAIATMPGTSVQIGQCTLSGGPGAAAIDGYLGLPLGAVSHDAATNFSPPFAGGTTALVPGSRGNGTTPGGAMTFQLEGPPNLAAVLAFSVDIRPPLAVAEGALWLDPMQFWVVLYGSTGAFGSLPGVINVPLGIPRGIAVTVQGAVLPPSGLMPLVASVPVGLLVR
jgi:hypothetical protein